MLPARQCRLAPKGASPLNHSRPSRERQKHSAGILMNNNMKKCGLGPHRWFEGISTAQSTSITLRLAAIARDTLTNTVTNTLTITFTIEWQEHVRIWIWNAGAHGFGHIDENQFHCHLGISQLVASSWESSVFCPVFVALNCQYQFWLKLILLHYLCHLESTNRRLLQLSAGIQNTFLTSSPAAYWAN